MRVIGLDVHRSMAVVAVLEKGHLSSGGRVDLTRDAVIKFGRKLRSDDEVVIEATSTRQQSSACCGHLFVGW